jgi:translation initiation factor IF-2
MRICDLAKELMTTGKELLGLLQERGCTARSTQANLTPELEQYLRDEIQRIYYGQPEAPEAAPDAPAEPAADAEPATADEPAPQAQAEPAPAAGDAPVPEPEAPAEPAVQAELAEPEGPKTIAIKGHVVVKDFAELLAIKPNVLITELMRLNIFASIGMKIEFKTAQKVADKLGFVLEHEKKTPPPPPPPKAEPKPEEPGPDTKDDLRPRPPVVTFMGHVDHGKTSLLDYIRKAHVAAGEDGGITQHIGAYQVDHDGRLITFLDTPGHEAFTAMRARGANLTDIAVIVVAADDGIMPQTKEAIQHAQAAKVAMIVAINKCDLRTANPDRVKRQLQQMGLAPEDWGGELICCSVSASTGEGMDHLLEMILLQAEVLELKANPRRKATGYVIESRMEAGMGPTANVLVTNGTLQLNDAVVSGSSWGRVKAMINDQGAKVRTAGPSAAVKLLGLTSVPSPGTEFHVYKNDREARSVAEERAAEKRLSDLSGPAEPRAPMTLDELLQEKAGSDKRTLNVIVKTDVLGSLEAIVGSFEGIKSDKVELEIIGTGVGNVSVNDVLLASASKAVILGFHVGKDAGSGAEAKRKGVEIRLYSIIYEMIDDVKNLLTGLLDPVVKEHVNGHAVIRQIFDMGKRGKVAGCMCMKGKVTLKGRVRVKRKDEVLYEGKIASLRRFQNEAAEVREGQECGIVLDRFTDILEGDAIESYEVEKVAQAL